MNASDNEYYAQFMHQRSGSLGVYYSENPWGPWTQFFYDEEWVVDHPDNRTYQPKLSPKWISEDGTEMVLIWSDQMYNWNTNYRWNQLKFKIELNQ